MRSSHFRRFILPKFTLTFALALAVNAVSAFTALYVFAGQGNGEAFYVEPMELHLGSVGHEVATLKVFNKEAFDSRIRIDVFERSEGADGSEQRTLTKDIEVDTGEFALKAGDVKSISIRYRGRSKISRERAYRVVVKQIDAPSVAQANRSLDLRFVYEAAVYVTPLHAKANLVVKDVRRTSGQSFEVDFQNDGNAHQKMESFAPRIEIADASGRRNATLSDESRLLLTRQNFLSGSRRKVVLQLAPKEILKDDTQVSLKLVRAEKPQR